MMLTGLVGSATPVQLAEPARAHRPAAPARRASSHSQLDVPASRASSISQLDRQIVLTRSASSNRQLCQLDPAAEPTRHVSSTSQLNRQIVQARSADLGGKAAIDLADSTFHRYRRRSQTISLSMQLSSHDLQRSACTVSPMHCL